MDKKTISLIIFISLFCLIDFSYAAVVIPNPLKGVNNFGDLLLKIADGVGLLIGALGTIMIIVAGILYLTSAGSPERMKVANTALIYAIVGIVIGITAKAIVATIKSIIGA